MSESIPIESFPNLNIKITEELLIEDGKPCIQHLAFSNTGNYPLFIKSLSGELFLEAKTDPSGDETTWESITYPFVISPGEKNNIKIYLKSDIKSLTEKDFPTNIIVKDNEIRFNTKIIRITLPEEYQKGTGILAADNLVFEKVDATLDIHPNPKPEQSSVINPGFLVNSISTIAQVGFKVFQIQSYDVDIVPAIGSMITIAETLNYNGVFEVKDTLYEADTNLTVVELKDTLIKSKDTENSGTWFQYNNTSTLPTIAGSIYPIPDEDIRTSMSGLGGSSGLTVINNMDLGFLLDDAFKNFKGLGLFKYIIPEQGGTTYDPKYVFNQEVFDQYPDLRIYEFSTKVIQPNEYIDFYSYFKENNPKNYTSEWDDDSLDRNFTLGWCPGVNIGNYMYSKETGSIRIDFIIYAYSSDITSTGGDSKTIRILIGSFQNRFSPLGEAFTTMPAQAPNANICSGAAEIVVSNTGSQNLIIKNISLSQFEQTKDDYQTSTDFLEHILFNDDDLFFEKNLNNDSNLELSAGETCHIAFTLGVNRINEDFSGYVNWFYIPTKIFNVEDFYSPSVDELKVFNSKIDVDVTTAEIAVFDRSDPLFKEFQLGEDQYLYVNPNKTLVGEIDHNNGTITLLTSSVKDNIKKKIRIVNLGFDDLLIYHIDIPFQVTRSREDRSIKLAGNSNTNSNVHGVNDFLTPDGRVKPFILKPINTPVGILNDEGIFPEKIFQDITFNIDALSYNKPIGDNLTFQFNIYSNSKSTNSNTRRVGGYDNFDVIAPFKPYFPGSKGGGSGSLGRPIGDTEVVNDGELDTGSDGDDPIKIRKNPPKVQQKPIDIAVQPPTEQEIKEREPDKNDPEIEMILSPPWPMYRRGYDSNEDNSLVEGILYGVNLTGTIFPKNINPNGTRYSVLLLDAESQSLLAKIDVERDEEGDLSFSEDVTPKEDQSTYVATKKFHFKQGKYSVAVQAKLSDGTIIEAMESSISDSMSGFEYEEKISQEILEEDYSIKYPDPTIRITPDVEGYVSTTKTLDLGDLSNVNGIDYTNLNTTWQNIEILDPDSPATIIRDTGTTFIVQNTTDISNTEYKYIDFDWRIKMMDSPNFYFERILEGLIFEEDFVNHSDPSGVKDNLLKWFLKRQYDLSEVDSTTIDMVEVRKLLGVDYSDFTIDGEGEANYNHSIGDIYWDSWNEVSHSFLDVELYKNPFINSIEEGSPVFSKELLQIKFNKPGLWKIELRINYQPDKNTRRTSYFPTESTGSESSDSTFNWERRESITVLVKRDYYKSEIFPTRLDFKTIEPSSSVSREISVINPTPYDKKYVIDVVKGFNEGDEESLQSTIIETNLSNSLSDVEFEINGLTEDHETTFIPRVDYITGFYDTYQKKLDDTTNGELSEEFPIIFGELNVDANGIPVYDMANTAYPEALYQAHGLTNGSRVFIKGYGSDIISGNYIIDTFCPNPAWNEEDAASYDVSGTTYEDSVPRTIEFTDRFKIKQVIPSGDIVCETLVGYYANQEIPGQIINVNLLLPDSKNSTHGIKGGESLIRISEIKEFNIFSYDYYYANDIVCLKVNLELDDEGNINQINPDWATYNSMTDVRKNKFLSPNEKLYAYMCSGDEVKIKGSHNNMHDGDYTVFDTTINTTDFDFSPTKSVILRKPISGDFLEGKTKGKLQYLISTIIPITYYYSVDKNEQWESNEPERKNII